MCGGLTFARCVVCVCVRQAGEVVLDDGDDKMALYIVQEGLLEVSNKHNP